MEKLDELQNRIVSIVYFNGHQPVSMLIKVRNHDRLHIWGDDVVMEKTDDIVEQEIFRKQCILFYTVIKPEKEEEMINRYIQENAPPVVHKDMNIG